MGKRGAADARLGYRVGTAGAVGLATATGCAPTVDVLGVYFPGWLASSVAGVAIAYVVVQGLARRSGARALAQSGLFFVSLTAGVALSCWWILFSRF